MQAANRSVDDVPVTPAQMPSGDALPAAFLELKKQLEEQFDLVSKKSDVISQQKARIAVLEELLRSNRAERFSASSESNPLQTNFFNEAELLGDDTDTNDDEQQSSDDTHADQGKPAKKRGQRQALNPNISRVQERLLLSDEQREGAIDTFFVTVKEELDITPAQVQVIEYLQEKAVYLDDNGQRKMVAAERPAHPLGKSIASYSLLAYIIIAKYCDGRVPRVRGSKGLEIVRNFTIDEGLAPRSRLAGAGFKPLQVAGVKSLGGERCSKRCGIDRIRWGSERRTQVNRYCRVITYSDDVETETWLLTRDEGRGEPVECSTGIWHKGGVNHCQAMVRNEGTCRPDVKGAAQLDSLRESQSTDAGHRGGDSRSRVEGLVMGLDRRGIVVQSRCEHNSRGDDVYS